MTEDELARLGITIGGRYRNRRDSYEVLQLKGDSILVRYDDGTTQLLEVQMQARIIRNMASEQQRAVPPGVTAADWARSLGILSRHARLEAEVPPQALDGFVKSYAAATGQVVNVQTDGFYPITVGGYNKWGSELRVYLPRQSANGLALPDGVTISAGTSPDTVRINNNGFWWFLVERNGLRIGSAQDVDAIRQALSVELRQHFDGR